MSVPITTTARQRKRIRFTGIAGVLAFLLVAQLIGMSVWKNSTAPAKAATASPTGTSSDGKITVTKTPSSPTVPAGGGTVTYTYVVTNNTDSPMYYTNLTDDKCGQIKYVGGMGSFFGQYIPAKNTAEFTCTMPITQDTTNTVTAKFTQMWTTTASVATASATVTVAPPAGTSGSTNSCDTLWYSSVYNTTNGSVGTLTTTGTAAPRAPMNMTDVYGMNGSAAVGVNPTNPDQISFSPRTDYTSGFYKGATQYDGGLWYLDAPTNASRRQTAKTAATTSAVRMGYAPSGTLYTVDYNGVVYSYTTTSGWKTVGTITLPYKPGTTTRFDWNTLDSGDLAFDGLGNMWIIASDSNTNTAYLFTITAASLATTTPQATLVGSMGTGLFNGLAFTSDGTLYATANVNGVSYLYTVNKDNGSTTNVSGSTGITGITGQLVADLGSCALPKPELRVTKTASPTQTVTSGSVITYTITVENIGTLSATGVTFQDLIPSGQTYVTGSAKLNGVQVNPTSTTNPFATVTAIKDGRAGTLSGVVGAGQTATITLQATVNATTGQVCNQATASMTGLAAALKSDDPSTATGADATCVNVATPGIAVDKTADATQVAGGTTVNYTYSVTNTGTEPLKTVTLSDDKCANPTLQPANFTTGKGDMDADGLLDVNETWVYTCSQPLTTTTTNTATANGTGSLTGKPVTAKDTWTVTVVNPNIDVVKTAGTVTGPDANGVYTATYTIKVTNTGDPATYGPLVDTPKFDPNVTVTGASWTGFASGSATGAGPYTIGTAHSLATGASETYTVSMTFTRKAGTTGSIAACAGPGTGLYNEVSAAGETATTTNNNACEMPAPAVDVVKKGGTVSGPDANGNYTVTYTITATNTSLVDATYGPITDTPAFDPATTKVVSASWTGAATGNATGSGPYTVGTSHTLAGGATDTYTMKIVFSHIANSGATSACAGSGTGLYNSVTAPGETATTTNNNACVTPPTYPGALSGTVYTDVNDNGDYNPGSTGGTDTPIQGATLTLKDSTGTVVGTTTTDAKGYYEFTNLTPGTYTVEYKAPNGVIVTQTYTVSNPSGIPGTNGTWSSGDATVVAGKTTTDVDFGIYTPNKPIHLKKLDPSGAALAGATFALYDVDPSTSGAAPVASGISADTAGGSTFTTTPLTLGKTYWIVETKAPNGYELLTDPIQVTVTSTGVTLAGDTGGVKVDSADAFTLDVTNQKSSSLLPQTGGLGADDLPIGGGLLVLLVAAIALARRRQELDA